MKEQLNQWEELYRFLDIKLIDVVDFTELLVRLVFNLVVIFYIAHQLYLKSTDKKDFYFSYLSIGTVTFLLCFLLNNVKLELGFALGLFAIFGIIRYRTDAIPIREMTYLFIVIALSVLNALAPAATGWIAVGAANVAVWIITFILDRLWAIRHLATKVVIYDRVDLLAEGRREELIRDLEQRTGVTIIRIEIGKVDLLRDTAVIKVHFDGDAQPGHFESQGGR